MALSHWAVRSRQSICYISTIDATLLLLTLKGTCPSRRDVMLSETILCLNGQYGHFVFDYHDTSSMKF